MLAADTTVTVDGEILGKPADAFEARAMLQRLSGRSHEVLTAVAVCQGARADSALSVSRVELLPPSDDAPPETVGEAREGIDLATADDAAPAEGEAAPESNDADAAESEDERARKRETPRFLRNYKIQEVIKRRQVMLIQVVNQAGLWSTCQVNLGDVVHRSKDVVGLSEMAFQITNVLADLGLGNQRSHQNENFRRVYSAHGQFEIGIKKFKTVWRDFSQV